MRKKKEFRGFFSFLRKYQKFSNNSEYEFNSRKFRFRFSFKKNKNFVYTFYRLEVNLISILYFETFSNLFITSTIYFYNYLFLENNN